MSETKPASMSLVSLQRCENYDVDLVLKSLRECLAPLGGMGAFVRPGQRVLLKPNLLQSTPPETAIDTHPSILIAVARLVREAGGTPVVADTPSANISTSPSGLKRLYRMTGLLAPAEAGEYELLYDVSDVSAPNPEGKLARRLELIRPALDADVIIGLPKLKTHVLTTFTGATKILFGLVPGLAKPGYHATFNDPELFGDFLLDIIVKLKPSLFIMDGIWGIEGDGPGQHGKRREANALLASADPVALDVACCRLVGIDPELVPPLRSAKKRGWWSGDPKEIKIAGPTPESFELVPFILPKNGGARLGRESMLPFPRITRRLAVSLISPRPVPIPAACTGCSQCVKACPVKAMSVRNGVAVVDDTRCVLCYCCHEICPSGAVELRLSRAGRWLKAVARRGA